MNRFIIALAGIVVFAGNVHAQNDCLRQGLSSFKIVVDAIYEEMGSPQMTPEIADKMDHEIFIRPQDKEPAFYRHVNISWGTFKATITAIISCEEYGSPVAERVIWRPGRALETIDMDAVLTE